jgi:RecA-family ATPase
MGFFDKKTTILDYLEKPSEIEFIWSGFKKGTVGLLTAPGATGKSFLALQFAMSASCGHSIFQFIQPDHIIRFSKSKVLYISAEDDETIIHDRMFDLIQNFDENELKQLKNIEIEEKAFDEDDNSTDALMAFYEKQVNKDDSVVISKTIQSLKENFEISNIVGQGFNLFGTSDGYTKEHNAICINELEAEAKNNDLIIIDTLTKIHCGDENSNGEMSELLRIFEGIAKRNNCSILILHHTNKSSMSSDTMDEQSSSRGASALVDNVRYHITLSKMSKKEHEEYDVNDDRSYYVKLTHSKVNYAQITKPIWLKRTSGGGFKSEILCEKSKGGKR